MDSPPNALGQLAAPPVFVVGMHRSGTTWVYEMLTAHPQAAGVFESGLFSTDLGLAPVFHPSHWYSDREALESDREFFGASFRLNQLLDREQALTDVRALAASWLARALEPQDRYLVEKTPQHLRTMAVIAELFPGCAFVHVIRDGRDVAVSVATAAQTWPRGRFRTAKPRAVAARWAAGIADARRQAQERELRYTEVRYEDLKADPPSRLGELLGFCGIEATEDQVAQMVGETTLNARRSGEGDAFRRRGEVGEWRERYGLLERMRFDRAAGTMLRELGYERSRGWWLRGDGGR